MTAIRNAADGDGAPEPAGPPPDPAQGRWSLIEMLLAQVVDELRVNRWIFVQANSKPGTGGRPPEPLKRPGAKPRKRRLTLKERMRLDPRLRKAAAEAGEEEGAEVV